MNSVQLMEIIKRHQCLKDTFKEITAINDLPEVIIGPYPQFFIFNDAPYPHPGKHWICVIFTSSSTAEYFDSLGKPPEFYGYQLKIFIDENSKRCYFTAKHLQSDQSDKCGLYVIYYLLMRLCFHIPMRQIYDMFNLNFKENDEMITLYFSRNVLQ